MRVLWTPQDRVVCMFHMGQDALASLRSIKMHSPRFRVECQVYGTANMLIPLKDLDLNWESVRKLNFPTEQVAENHERAQLAKLGSTTVCGIPAIRTQGFDANGSEVSEETKPQPPDP